MIIFISIEILDRLWDFVNDEPEGNDEEDGEGEPLAVRRYVKEMFLTHVTILASGDFHARPRVLHALCLFSPRGN